jgi:hypothetical protein
LQETKTQLCVAISFFIFKFPLYFITVL